MRRQKIKAKAKLVSQEGSVKRLLHSLLTWMEKEMIKFHRKIQKNGQLWETGRVLPATGSVILWVLKERTITDQRGSMSTIRLSPRTGRCCQEDSWSLTRKIEEHQVGTPYIKRIAARVAEEFAEQEIMLEVKADSFHQSLLCRASLPALLLTTKKIFLKTKKDRFPCPRS